MSSKEKVRETFDDYQQRVFIKCVCFLDWSSSVVHANCVKIFGRSAYSLSTVKYWMKRVKEGNGDVSERRGGSVPDEVLFQQRVDEIKEKLAETRHWSVRSLSNVTGIPYGTTLKILKEKLGLKKRLSRWVPHELSDIQLEHRILACRLNLETYKKNKNLLERTLSIDETWVALYMEPSHDQRGVWIGRGEAPPHVPRESRNAEKRMLIMALDYNGIAFYKLLPHKTTVDANLYMQFLCDYIPTWLVGKSFRRPVLHHDNARPHKARIVTDLLREKEISTWYQPPYSPDISPLDYDCFHKLKRKLKGVHHRSWEQFEYVLKEVVEQLNNTQACLGVRELPDRWQRVIDSEGQYL